MDAEQTAPAAPAPPAPAPSTTPPAPAQPTATTAADQAVASNDVAAYREARRTERGEPRPSQPRTPAGTFAKADAPAAPAEAAAPATPEQRAVSKRQQQINDYERTVAELRAENARLKGTAAPAPPDRPAARPAGPPPIDITRPALEEAAFYTQHPEASTADFYRYVTRYDREVERVTEQMRAAQTAADQAAHARAEKFHAQVTAAGDPAVLIERLDPDLIALETRAAASAQGKPISAANDLADEILDSDVAIPVLEYLTAHPEAKATLLAAPNRRALVRAFTQLEAQFTPAAPSASAPKTITAAPAPAVTLGSRPAQMGDPVDRAVMQGDVAAYRAARLAQRAATVK